jgi:hypothetical protein
LNEVGLASRIAACLASALLLAGCARDGDADARLLVTTAVAPVVPRPAAPAAFDPFPGRENVPVRDLFAALSREADRLSTSQVVRDEYRRLMQAHGLPDDDALFADYLRVRIAFEATRAGGLWGLQWRVTDQLPQSDRIWAQWDALAWPADGTPPFSTAIAECDELSALFAVVARGMGLSARSRTGLFWPTSNHTVAVWTIQSPPAGSANMPAEVRIVVPTSQVFLDGAQSLGTRRFDPWTQPKVFAYARRDIADDHPLPAALARYFVQQVRRHAGDPQGFLQTARNRREYDQRMTARNAGEDRR